MNINRTGSSTLAGIACEPVASAPVRSVIHNETRDVSPAGMRHLIGELTASVNNWKQSVPGSNEQSRWPAHWQERFLNAGDMLEHMESGLANKSAHNFAHYANNELAGLMVLFAAQNKPGNPASVPAIHTIVTHPGTTGAGSLLAEKAVGLSDHFGHGGKVLLDAYDGEAMTAFEKMGFRKLPSDDEDLNMMQLDPASSDSWEKENGHWKMKNTQGSDQNK